MPILRTQVKHKLKLIFLLLLVCFRDRRVLQPAQVCDILKGVILVVCYFMMHYVDYSMMYHLIRGQSVIKLYIIYNMLEVRLSLPCVISLALPPQTLGWAHAPNFKSSHGEGT